MEFSYYMDKLLKDYNRESNEDILKTARIISLDNKEVIQQVELAIDKPKKYLGDHADRFSERGINFADKKAANEFDVDELLLLAMVDELEEHGYVFELDWKCELSDFLWGLEQIKNYNFIADVIPTVSFDEDEDIEIWGKDLNTALGGKAYVCYINIDSDSFPLTIVTAEAFKNIPISMVHSIVVFE